MPALWHRIFCVSVTALDSGEPFNFSDLSAFTQSIPIEWVTSALEPSAQTSIRRRCLPSDQAFWLALGMALFSDEPIHEIARRLNIKVGEPWNRKCSQTPAMAPRPSLPPPPITQVNFLGAARAGDACGCGAVITTGFPSIIVDYWPLRIWAVRPLMAAASSRGAPILSGLPVRRRDNSGHRGLCQARRRVPGWFGREGVQNFM